MASFHTSGFINDDILLDDDIVNETPLPKTMSSLSFEYIEYNIDHGGGRMDRSFSNLVPTAEEGADVEQEAMEAFPSSISFSRSRNASVDTKSPAPVKTPPQGPELLLTIDDDDESVGSPALGTKHKNVRDGATSISLGTPRNISGSNTPHNDDVDDWGEGVVQGMKKISEPDNGSNSSSDFGNNNDKKPIDANTRVSSVVVDVNIDEKVPQAEKTEKTEKTENATMTRKPKKTEQGPDIEMTTLSDEAVIQITPTKPSINDDSLPQDYYGYPSSELIDVSANVANAVSYNSLPSISSLRVLSHNELQQLHIYNRNEFAPGIALNGKNGIDIKTDKKRTIDQKLTILSLPAVINPQHGWYKWIILAMTWLSLLLVSLTLSASLYTKTFELHFNISRSTASWFPSIQLALFCLANAFAPKCCDLFGPYLVLASALFMTLWGFLIPSLLLNFYAILIIHSVLVGIGSGLIQIAALYILSDYFSLVPGDITRADTAAVVTVGLKSEQTTKIEINGSKNSPQFTSPQPNDGQTKTKLSISFAVGFALSAFGIGNISWSPYINHFLDTNLHYKEAFVYTGCFVFGFGTLILLLMHPRTYSNRSTKELIACYLQEEMDKLIQSLPPKTSQLLKDEPSGWDAIIYDLVDKSLKTYAIDSTLFSQPAFSVLFMTGIFGSFMFYAPFVHLLPHAQDYGMSQTGASNLLIIIGVFAVVFRIVFSFLVEFIHPLICLIVSLCLQLVCAVVWYYSDSDAWFQATAAIAAVSAAGFVVSMSALPKRIFSSQKHIIPALAMIYGLSFAPAAILVGPLMGWVKDEYGEYNRFIIALVIIACLAILSSGCLILGLAFKSVDDVKETEERAEKDKAFVEYQESERKREIAQILIQRSMTQPRLDGIQEDYDGDKVGNGCADNAAKGDKNIQVERLTGSKLENYIESVLKTRPITINPHNQAHLWYIHPSKLRTLATQYAIALAHWSLGRREGSGWRRLYR